jgi:hypothetical protein
MENVDTSPPLDKKGKKYIQEVIGTFLYYARCIDSTMLPALGSLTTQQANPMQNTKKIVHKLLDYAATHPNAIITYRASDMALTGHNDASYLSETNARSRAGGHFFMSNDEAIPGNNCAILTVSQIIKAVMLSAAEAEIKALYINCKEAIPARHTLEYLGHKQPPTPMQTDNTTGLGGVVNNNVMKKFKSMDMKYHWLQCRNNQRQFRHYWAAGKSTMATTSPNITRPSITSNTINFSHSTNHTSKTTQQSPKSTPRSKGVLDTQYPAIIHG